MGFYLEGFYLGFETREFKNDDGSIDIRHSMNIATGRLAYRCYMSKDFDPVEVSELELKPGDKIMLSCRVYVGKNGKLSIVDAEICK